MGWKEILVYVDGQSSWHPTADAACALAVQHQAHLVGIEVIHMPERDGYLTRGLGTEFLEQRRRDLEQDARRLGAEFLAWAGRARVQAEWRVADGELARVLAMHARHADVVVLAPPAPRTLVSLEAPHLAASLVLAAGRPIILVPSARPAQAIGTNVVIGWNASREATRAVTDALPILERAARVSVVMVRPETGRAANGSLPGADVAHYLARHGTNAEVVQLEGEDADVGTVLLEQVNSRGADLLVMGAYGHSRLRELVLGGATSTVLGHTRVAVLMSH